MITILVSHKNGHKDGMLIGDPEFVYDGEAFISDSNSSTSEDGWAPEPNITSNIGGMTDRLCILITDEDVQIGFTKTKNGRPDENTAVPVRTRGLPQVAYNCFLPGGKVRIFVRKL